MSNQHEDRDIDGCTIDRLTDAISALAASICSAASANLVTRCDLNATEARLTAIIQAGWTLAPDDQKILDALLARSGRVARKLEALDAKTLTQ